MKKNLEHKWMVSGVMGLVGWLWLSLGVAQASVDITIPQIDPRTLAPITGGPTLILSAPSSPWLPEPGVGVPVRASGVSTGATIRLVVPPATVNTDGTINEAGLPLPITAALFDGMHNPFLVAGALTTSAYPGVCTNTPSFPVPPLPTLPTLPLGYFDPDFTYVSNTLTSHDCGGFAVFQVIDGSAKYIFIAPQDSDHDGIPDAFENSFTGGLDPLEDQDTSGENNTNKGDGITAFDEYRGFMVGGRHVRTDPRSKKDLFVQFDITNPQCTTSQFFLATGLTQGPRLFENSPTNTLPVRMSTFFDSSENSKFVKAVQSGDAALLFNLDDLQAHTSLQIQRILSTEWVNHFTAYDVADSSDKTFKYLAGTDLAVSDRQINQNAVFRALNAAGSPIAIQKGIRILECLDLTVTQSTYGFAAFTTPNGQGSGDGNALIFPQRIVHNVECLFLTHDAANKVNGVLCSPAKLNPSTAVYKTFPGTCPNDCDTVTPPWTLPRPSYIDISNVTRAIDKNFIVTKLSQFFLAMEVGHGIDLITSSLTNCAGCLQHFSQQTGDNLDQYIGVKLDTCPLDPVTRKKICTVSQVSTFRIPKSFGTADQASFTIKN